MTLHHTVVEKEMGITRAEFFRIAARFLEGRNHALTDDGFIVEEGGKTLEATLTKLEDRTITPNMILPRLIAHFSFTGHTNEDVHDLIAIIDRHFQRGGG